MELTDAYTEFLLAHDYQPATTHSYADRLGAFMSGVRGSSPRHHRCRPLRPLDTPLNGRAQDHSLAQNGQAA